MLALIPAGGGTKELALRAYDNAKQGQNADPMPFLQKAFMLIGMAQTSTSGLEAIEMGLYPQDATVSISREITKLIELKSKFFKWLIADIFHQFLKQK